MPLSTPIRLVCPRCGRSAPPGAAPGEQCGHDGAVLVNQDVVARTTESPLLGTLLTDNYAVYDLIGRGGMGTVYKAIHQRLDRVVAVKSIHLQVSDPDEAEELKSRFSQEARTLSRLRHPGIVTVYDYGEVAGGLYMILEYIEGESLWSVLHEEGPLPVERAIPIVRQLLEALDSPHRAGLVHRDIKPSNVMLERDRDSERVVLIDFGIAKINEAEPDGIPQTRTGQVIGTVKYMPPEQLKGEALGPWTDQYAVGCLLYRTLCGSPPFTGSRAEVAAAQLRDDPPPLPAALGLEAFDAVIARAMAKSPADRYASNEAFVEDLLNAWVRYAGSADVKITAPISVTGSVQDAGRLSLDGTVNEHTNSVRSIDFASLASQNTQSTAPGPQLVDDSLEETSQTNLRGALSDMVEPPRTGSRLARAFIVGAASLFVLAMVTAFLFSEDDSPKTSQATQPSVLTMGTQPVVEGPNAGKTEKPLRREKSPPAEGRTAEPEKAAGIEGETSRADNKQVIPGAGLQPEMDVRKNNSRLASKGKSKSKRVRARRASRAQRSTARVSRRTRGANQRVRLAKAKKANSAFNQHLERCQCRQAKASLAALRKHSLNKKTVNKAQERYNLACALIGHGCNRASGKKRP